MAAQDLYLLKINDEELERMAGCVPLTLAPTLSPNPNPNPNP